MFCLISSCYTVDNAIKLASDIFTEVSKKLSQQDLKVCKYQCTVVPLICLPSKRSSRRTGVILESFSR